MTLLWKWCSCVVYILKDIYIFISDSAGGVIGGGGVVHWNGVQITQPHNIEVPRSLLDVVVSWNIPMHKWLKTCEYWVITHFGSTTTSHKKPQYDVFLWWLEGKKYKILATFFRLLQDDATAIWQRWIGRFRHLCSLHSPAWPQLPGLLTYFLNSFLNADRGNNFLSWNRSIGGWWEELKAFLGMSRRPFIWRYY